MFSNLLFLAIALLIATMTAPLPTHAFSPEEGFGWALTVYAFTLLLLAVQNRFLVRSHSRRIPAVLFLANIELLCSLALFFFYFEGQRILTELPILNGLLTPPVLLSLVLYFGGLAFFHWTLFPNVQRQPFAPRLSRQTYVGRPLRFLTPFAIPFVLFSILGDIVSFIPVMGPEGITGWILSIGISLLFVGTMLVFFPPLLTTCWRCLPLPEGATRERLNAWCRKANFKHAGMLTWPVMGQHLTAAIIGIVPRFRYVMFTPSLLLQLSPESLEAVLVHEIGHTRRKHLLIYPFVILGAMLIVGLLTQIALTPIDNYLELKNFIDPSGPWLALQPVILCATYVIVLALYFRIVFGFFSRLFERQADLTCFDLGMPPQNMINALNEVGFLSGNIHDHPSWHHYSIRQRMNFLKQAEESPELVTQHHRFVRKALIGYFILLALGTLLLVSTLATPDAVLSRLSSKIDTSLNNAPRLRIAKTIADSEHLRGDPTLIVLAIENAMQLPGTLQVPGLIEVYAARQLYDSGEYQASGQLLTNAWQKLDFKSLKPEAFADITRLTNKVLTELGPYPQQAAALRASQKR